MGKFVDAYHCKRKTVEALAEQALAWGDGTLVRHEKGHLGVYSPSQREVQYGCWIECNTPPIPSTVQYFRALTDEELAEVGFVNYEAINLGTGVLVYTDKDTFDGDLWVCPEPVGPDEDWVDARGGEWEPGTWFRINTWPEVPLEPEPVAEEGAPIQGGSVMFDFVDGAGSALRYFFPHMEVKPDGDGGVSLTPVPPLIMPPSPGVSDLDAVAIVLGDELVGSALEMVQAAKLARQAYWAELGEPRKSEPKQASLTAWVRALQAAAGHLQEV